MVEAYAAVSGGRAFVFPQAVGSIEQARAYGRAQVDRGLAALAAGRSAGGGPGASGLRPAW